MSDISGAMSPRKLRNGMIAIIDGTISNTSKKWLDIEITNTWPMIALGSEATLVHPGGVEDIGGYDHLSIPPDLRLHLSGTPGQLMFDARPAWAIRDRETPAALHWFTFVGKPIAQADLLSGPQTRKWDETALIPLIPDALLDPSRTRAAVDFLLHKGRLATRPDGFPIIVRGMRLAFHRRGCSLGPFQLEDIQRRAADIPGLLFTLRFGFVEFDNKSGTVLNIPLATHRRS